MSLNSKSEVFWGKICIIFKGQNKCILIRGMLQSSLNISFIPEFFQTFISDFCGCTIITMAFQIRHKILCTLCTAVPHNKNFVICQILHALILIQTKKNLHCKMLSIGLVSALFPSFFWSLYTIPAAELIVYCARTEIKTLGFT